MSEECHMLEWRIWWDPCAKKAIAFPRWPSAHRHPVFQVSWPVWGTAQAYISLGFALCMLPVCWRLFETRSHLDAPQLIFLVVYFLEFERPFSLSISRNKEDTLAVGERLVMFSYLLWNATKKSHLQSESSELKLNSCPGCATGLTNVCLSDLYLSLTAAELPTGNWFRNKEGSSLLPDCSQQLSSMCSVTFTAGFCP